MPDAVAATPPATVPNGAATATEDPEKKAKKVTVMGVQSLGSTNCERWSAHACLPDTQDAKAAVKAAKAAKAAAKAAAAAEAAKAQSAGNKDGTSKKDKAKAEAEAKKVSTAKLLLAPGMPSTFRYISLQSVQGRQVQQRCTIRACL